MSSALTPSMRRRVLPAALLLAALLAFPSARPAHAVGEPTLTIVMSSTALTSGTTSLVTFQFSAVPIGFDNSDVNLGDANGTLSTAAPGGDARTWTATFTPNVGVNDDTNVISVGVQWTDSVGVSPLGPSTGPNYSINTAASSSSVCPPPSLAVASPNGGETFVAGDAVDVFWTANGCQVSSVAFALSVDGGVSYAAPFATSASPFSGYYRWTVPDVDASSARLRVTLVGHGGVEFASDETDGNFTIFPSQPAATADPPPPAATAAAEAPAPPPEEPPPPAPADATGGTAPPPEPAPETAPAATTAAPARPRAEAAFAPRPAAVAPSATTPPAERPPTSESLATPTPVESDTTAMPETNDNQAVNLENVQAAVETAAQFAPSYMELGFSFVLGALAMLAAMLAARKVMRDRRDKLGRTCGNCHGSGEKPRDGAPLAACADCDGLGTIEEEEEQAVECVHCKGEGTDPCHECKGDGKDASGNECAACRGGGLTLDDPEDEASDEPADCEICGGEGEVGAALKRQVACETCHGTGKS